MKYHYILLLLTLFYLNLHGSVAGLPFTEDFNTTALKDTSASTAS